MKLTISIPTYNRAGSLSSTLQSLADIGWPSDVEVIVVDNCSIDSTAAAVGDFMSRGVKYIKNDFNLGIEGNIIKALQVGSGHYIWVISDHMQVQPCGFRALLKCLGDFQFDIGYAGIVDFGDLGVPSYRTINLMGLCPVKVGQLLFCVSNISGVIASREYVIKNIRCCYRFAGYTYPHIGLYSVHHSGGRFVYFEDCSYFGRAASIGANNLNYNSLRARFIEFILAVKAHNIPQQSGVIRGVTYSRAYWSGVSEEIIKHMFGPSLVDFPSTCRAFIGVIIVNPWRIKILVISGFLGGLARLMFGYKCGFLLFRIGRRIGRPTCVK